MQRILQRTILAPLFFVVLISILYISIDIRTAGAQFFDASNSVALVNNPAYPAPNTETTVGLSAYTINTSGATIRWYVNGAEVAEAKNTRDIQITTGGLGSKTTVRALITLPNGAPITVEETIIPAEIDLIIAADTLTPSFYEGRALPIGDEPVNVTALIHDGTNAKPDSFTYTWKLGSNVLFGGPVVGTPNVTFTMPKSQTNLSVTIENKSGKVIGKSIVALKPAKPELYFYENNPLRGQSQNAIKNTLTLIGNETSVRAEPYFVAKDIFSSKSIFNWSLDNREVDNGDVDPQQITLRGTGGSGYARVGFKLTNTKSLLQYVDEFFTIYFEQQS